MNQTGSKIRKWDEINGREEEIAEPDVTPKDRMDGPEVGPNSNYLRTEEEQHRQEIMLHKVAKDAFNQLEGKKPPNVKTLSAQYAQILAEKKKLYEEYRFVRKEMMDYQVAKRDIDDFLKIDQEQKTENRKKSKTRIR